MKVLLIKPDQSQTEVDITDDVGLDQLKALQKLVEGYIEPVHTHSLTMRGNIALVDEDGLMKGSPRNIKAELAIGYAGKLVGNVVICGEIRTGEGSKFSDYNS